MRVATRFTVRVAIRVFVRATTRDMEFRVWVWDFQVSFKGLRFGFRVYGFRTWGCVALRL